MDSEDRPEPTVPASRPTSIRGLPRRDRGASARQSAASYPDHWGKILTLWAVLTAALVYALSATGKPMYESFSLVRVEPSRFDLFNAGLSSGAAEAFAPFLQTQVELLRSPNVLERRPGRAGGSPGRRCSKSHERPRERAARAAPGRRPGGYLPDSRFAGNRGTCGRTRDRQRSGRISLPGRGFRLVLQERYRFQIDRLNNYQHGP